MMAAPKRALKDIDTFQEKVSTALELSFTEEQQFLQEVLSGEIKTYSHEDVIADLRKVLKR